MDLDQAKSLSIPIFLGLILVLLSASVIVNQDKNMKNSKSVKIDSIEFQNRIGNVVRTKFYIVKLANGSEFRYVKSIPGPGMVCGTNNSSENCKIEAEPGYREIENKVSSGKFRKTNEGFSTVYHPKNEICVENISSRNLELINCGLAG